jgi:hypothetical protein
MKFLLTLIGIHMKIHFRNLFFILKFEAKKIDWHLCFVFTSYIQPCFMCICWASWVCPVSLFCAMLLLMCISELPSPFHQFGLLVALVSAWSLTWYQSPGSRVRVLVFAIYYKNCCCPPLCPRVDFSRDRRRQFAPASISPVPVLAAASLLPWFVTREWGCWCV